VVKPVEAKVRNITVSCFQSLEAQPNFVFLFFGVGIIYAEDESTTYNVGLSVALKSIKNLCIWEPLQKTNIDVSQEMPKRTNTANLCFFSPGKQLQSDVSST
jgi:hypothetical protein